ncbi:MAG: restriction endonuclease subunit S, partial [Caldisericales bacterium]|nr:restriction endonuclease subunit S [Caldisericales bacterium]
MKKYHQYLCYKESGVEWLGEIPYHWKVERLKWSVNCCQNGIWGNDPDGKNDFPCVRVADFDRIRNRVNLPIPTMRAIPKSDSQNHILLKGDLLIEKSGGGDL